MDKKRELATQEIKVTKRGCCRKRRVFGCNRHNSTIDVDIDACAFEGEEAGKGHYMSVKPETMGFFLFDVYGG
jgi:hypothetical protein